MLRDGTSSRTGTAPLSINFINSSTGGITAYAWTFGDGTTSTSQHPVHVYPVAGTYTVSLEVTGPGGTNTKTLASYVKLMAPAAADATPPGAPSSVVARASGSTMINLKWNASTDDDGVTGYRIERCQGATCATLAQIATTAAGTAAKTGTATSLTATPNPSVVYSLQDTYNSDVEPSSTLAFSHYGLTDFAVQGYNGSARVTLATVANNRLVKRTAMFVKLPAPGS